MVPVFQRDYRWEEEQCEKFWDDVVRIARDDGSRGDHFLGSVVYISTEDTSAGFTRWQLIDGQQRVTTLTLLLAALRDLMRKDPSIVGDDGPEPDTIDGDFLRNPREKGEKRQKLQLRRYDNETLQAIIFGQQQLPKKHSERIVDSYNYFYGKLAGADPSEIYRGIGRLVVVDINLDRASDDPQLIFESLNSTGIDLNQSDLIRNFVLMRPAAVSEQDRLYETYWRHIEVLYRNSEKTFDTFVRDYLALRTRASKQVKANQIYREFQRYLEDEGGELSLEAVLKDMLLFSRYNAAFTVSTYSHDWSGISQALERLRTLGEASAPLIMQLFYLHDHKETLSIEAFNKAIRVVESYLLRRAVCKAQNRDYWRIFSSIAYRLDEKDPVSKITAGLEAQRTAYAYPSDDEFRRELLDSDIYRLRVRFFLLERLENFGSREQTDTSDYTIEHILPQNENLPGAWREMLGENWREIQETWVHRLGNLTLTGYNSTYSDRPFHQKKSIKGGFAESSVRLNKFVREQSQWTEKEIKQRGEILADQALEIWPHLQVEESAVEDAKRAELMERGKDRLVEAVEMNTVATALFNELRVWIKERFPGLTEQPTARERGIGYYTPYEFLEILPRQSSLLILLVGDYGEIDDPNGIVEDASERKYFHNSGDIEPGVFLQIRDSSDITKAKPAIRHAYDLLDR